MNYCCLFDIVIGNLVTSFLRLTDSHRCILVKLHACILTLLIEHDIAEQGAGCPVDRLFLRQFSYLVGAGSFDAAEVRLRRLHAYLDLVRVFVRVAFKLVFCFGVDAVGVLIVGLDVGLDALFEGMV